MTRVAGYIRMSTSKQAMSPDVQFKKIKSWYKHQKENGRWGDDAEFVGVFQDNAVSAGTDMLDRPQGQRIPVSLERGDVVIAASLTRAFRSAADAERTMRILEEAGIGLVLLDVDMDTTTSTGKLFVAIMAACAKFEKDLIGERTKEALRYKRHVGQPICLPPVGWSISNKRFCPNVNERVLGNAARRLFRKGRSRDEVWSLMGKSMRSKRMKPMSERWYVTAASAASLEFPKQSISFLSNLMETNLDTLKFIRRDDHESVVKEMKDRLAEEGLPND